MTTAERNPQSSATSRASVQIQSYRVLIKSIDTTKIGQTNADPRGIAQTIDTFGKLRQIGVSTMVGSGTYPQVGEEWTIDQTLGTWTFQSRLKAVTPEADDFISLAQGLNQLGLLDYSGPTNDADLLNNQLGLPPRVTTGTTIQSFTDALGDAWVAQNGVNSGAWKRARDVINLRWVRGGGWTTPSTPNTWVILAMDTVIFDAYGLYNSSTGLFTAPISGLYSLHVAIGFNTAVSGATFGAAIYKNGSVLKSTSITNSAGTGYAEPQNSTDDKLSVGDTIAAEYYSSLASNSSSGRGVAETQIAIAYMGTG